MLTIYFIRHGECQGNREKRFRGRHDFPLNENGIRQAHQLKQALEGISFQTLYTSPLSRCRQTADIIANGHIPVVEEEGFINIRLGEWENTPQSVIRERYPELWNIWHTHPEKLRFPGMEPIPEVQHRALAALQAIQSHHSGETIGIVSHKVVLKALIAGLLNIPEPYFWKIHMDTAAYSIVEYSAGRGYTLMQLNQNLHLSDIVREDLE
ncbi:MAG: histidine phosphatase family protein [Calditrichaeota bacterium]|nr:histidine phosphatase family protein [Calditrichota bacterium]